MTPPHWFCALAARVEGFLQRHWKTALGVLVVLVAVEGARLVARDKMGDFKALHAAAVRLWQAEPLYQPRDGRAYPYSPTFALALLPLAALPLGASKALWYALSVVSIAVSYRLASKILWSDRSPAPGFYLLMASGSLYFGHNALLHGQPTPLMVMLVLLAYDLDLRERPVAAGLCLAASAMIKPFPVLFVAFFLIRKRWRAALASSLFAAALLAAPVLVFGSEYARTLGGWITMARQQQELYDLTGTTNQSVSAFCNRLFGVDRPEAFSIQPTVPNALIAATTAAALVTALWSAGRAAGAPGSHAAFGLFMICWAALPPMGWKHYYCTLLFPCGVLARTALEDGAWGRAASRVLLFCAACVVALKVGGDVTHAASLALWSGAAAFGVLSAYALRSRDADAGPAAGTPG